MADAIVSAILQQLARMGVDEVQGEVNLVLGVEEQVRKLSSNFLAIQAVLADAEIQQLKKPAVRDWVEKLKAVSYDIDDVLDEWNTALMRTRFERGGTAHYHTKKVCSLLPSPCFCCKHVAFRREIAKKIEVLNKRLDVVAIEKDRYQLRSLTVKHPEGQITGPVIDVSEIAGREHDKSRIIQLLLSESSQVPNPHVISIVGMGGIGKTTLAQIAYNDNGIESHFERRIWVCVSDPFDEFRVARGILESILGSTPNLVELGNILEQIRQHISGKKFLLILDDVWDDDFNKWKQLKHCFSCGLKGSKILLTTRKESVAHMMGSSDPVHLGLLSAEESWSLFSRFAFFDGEIHESQHVEDIGKEIVNKCKGLPLAIKTLGSLLRFKKLREDWQFVLDSELWEIENGERDFFAPLRLSYYDLPHEIKQCFLYCAIFPKDHIFNKRELIKFWIAQGFITPSKGKASERVGREYFESLVTRSFFQDFEKNSLGVIVRCKMHDIVHDFAQSLTKNECTYF